MVQAVAFGAQSYLLVYQILGEPAPVELGLIKASHLNRDVPRGVGICLNQVTLSYRKEEFSRIPGRSFSMKRNLFVGLSLCMLAALFSGCSQKNSDNAAPASGASSGMSGATANDHDAVVAAIQKHLTSDSGVNMSVMEMTVENVSVNGDQAQANAAFHLKQGGQSMNITYQLERRAGDWVVLSDTPGGGQLAHPPLDKDHSGAASPNSAEPLPDATDYLKNHAPPAKQ